MRVLGIDPGLRITGYACLEGIGGAVGGMPRIVEAGVFRLGKVSAAAASAPEPDSTGAIDLARRVAKGGAASVSTRLLELDRDFAELLTRVKPDVLAVESIFAHSKHPATSIIMAHARGVLLLNGKRAGLRLVELRPATIKKALTGNGQAVKAQMQRAVQERFRLAELPSPPDLADALAIALCAIERLGGR
jgi:crossover junction endodeoxyribonuclease RuvC